MTKSSSKRLFNKGKAKFSKAPKLEEVEEKKNALAKRRKKNKIASKARKKNRKG